MRAVFIDGNEALALLSYLPSWGRVVVSREPLAPVWGEVETVLVAKNTFFDVAPELARMLRAKLIPPKEFYKTDLDKLHEVGVVVVDADADMKLITIRRI